MLSTAFVAFCSYFVVLTSFVDVAVGSPISSASTPAASPSVLDVMLDRVQEYRAPQVIKPQHHTVYDWPQHDVKDEHDGKHPHKPLNSSNSAKKPCPTTTHSKKAKQHRPPPHVPSYSHSRTMFKSHKPSSTAHHADPDHADHGKRHSAPTKPVSHKKQPCHTYSRSRSRSHTRSSKSTASAHRPQYYGAGWKKQPDSRHTAARHAPSAHV